MVHELTDGLINHDVCLCLLRCVDFVDGNKKSIMGVIFLLINKAKPVEDGQVPGLALPAESSAQLSVVDLVSPRSRAKTWVKSPTGAGYTQRTSPSTSYYH
jgi:hypothetical protein